MAQTQFTKRRSMEEWRTRSCLSKTWQLKASLNACAHARAWASDNIADSDRIAAHVYNCLHTQPWRERERDSSDDVADSDLIAACVHVHEHICACASAKRVAACAGLAWWVTRMGRVQIGCSDKIGVADKAMLYFAHTLIPVKCLIEKSNTRALPSARNHSDQMPSNGRA